MISNFLNITNELDFICSSEQIENNRYSKGKNFSKSYRFGFNGKEHDDEPNGAGNQYDYGFRIYNPRLGRFLSVDPLTSTYPFYTPYQFAGNDVIRAIDLDGLEKVYVFDQGSNPNNKRVYTAKIYVVTDDQVVHGPYQGSSFPNDPNSHNTLDEGTVPYNNKYGHKGGTQKGLNIVDDNGDRKAPGIKPNGSSTTMTNVNVHSGQDPETNNDRENRGSQGCPTVKPSDQETFFENFDFSSGNTGNASGTITVYRGNSEEALNKETGLVNQLEQQAITSDKPIEVQRDTSTPNPWQ